MLNNNKNTTVPKLKKFCELSTSSVRSGEGAVACGPSTGRNKGYCLSSVSGAFLDPRRPECSVTRHESGCRGERQQLRLCVSVSPLCSLPLLAQVHRSHLGVKSQTSPTKDVWTLVPITLDYVHGVRKSDRRVMVLGESVLGRWRWTFPRDHKRGRGRAHTRDAVRFRWRAS